MRHETPPVSVNDPSKIVDFQFIYDQYWESLFAFAFRFTGDKDDASDLVQETFLSYLLHSETLQIGHSIKSYLFTSLKNKALNYLEKNSVRLKAAPLYRDLLQQNGHDENSFGLETKEVMALVENVVNSLPDRIHEVFNLRWKEELSSKEIAKKLGISDQTVRNQLSTALRTLRLKLNDFLIWAFILLFFNIF